MYDEIINERSRSPNSGKIVFAILFIHVGQKYIFGCSDGT